MNLKFFYKENVKLQLLKEFHYKNVHEIPKVNKIVISIAFGLQGQNRNFLQKAIEEIRLITGQHPITTKAKRSISGFKIREKMILGLMVTLRNEKMYSFLEKLIKLVLPRVRDFRGLNTNQFDKHGNYNLGIFEQLIFPEIDYGAVEQRRGFNINISTTAKNSKEGFFLLKKLGFPFSNTNKNKNL
jgi:large subunit ribosomal protein L5